MITALSLVLASGGGYGYDAYHDQGHYRRCEPVVRRAVYARPTYYSRPIYRPVRYVPRWDSIPRARHYDRTYSYRPTRYVSYPRYCR